MSKNVAVFVDVANIFYAAKAAGIDIDYVTLLKSATAGRDFVRAYAYTGLDPDNDNQRQFHAFLARNGYKVISKDIRKYGDGRMKANLDIELVVDLIKTARNLDIAVVVSGDGDFASAIRAVQEMGVRVEVISFRGNTSSDLIDVADSFTDIAQVARVDRGSRSGRRVAAEDDLSMTEVPEKETEGAPRRRRSPRREERAAAEAAPAAPATAAAAAAPGLAAATASEMVVLPGEHLSRVGEEAAATAAAPAEEEPADVDGNGDAAGEDGRRRRRRRGGRGRGRGRRPDGEPSVEDGKPEAGNLEAGNLEDEEEFEELPTAQPVHQAFGSVWDTQIGVPTTLPAAIDAGAPESDEEDLEEPEVPEYLLAERRQRGQRPPRGRMGHGRSTYQQALDRERFGRGTAQPSFGGGRTPERADRGRDRGPAPRQPSRGRPAERFQRVEERSHSTERQTSSEPWSEVPPELEELLRAELARKTGPAEARQQRPRDEVRDGVPAAAQQVEAAVAPEAPAEAKPVRSRATTTRAATRTTKPKAPAKAEASAASAVVAEEVPAESAPAKAAPRRRVTRATRADATVGASAEAAAPPEPEKKPVRRRRTASPES